MYPRRKRSTELSRGEIARGWAFSSSTSLSSPCLGQLQALLSLRFHFFLQPAEFSLIYYFLLCARPGPLLGLAAPGFSRCWTAAGKPFAFVAGLVGPRPTSWWGSSPCRRTPPLPTGSSSPAPTATAVVLVVLMPLLEEPCSGASSTGPPVVQPGAGLRRPGVLPSCLGGLLPEGATLLLLLAVEYLPMSLALCWCYDNGGSIWSAVGLHMVLNAAELITVVRGVSS